MVVVVVVVVVFLDPVEILCDKKTSACHIFDAQLCNEMMVFMLRNYT